MRIKLLDFRSREKSIPLVTLSDDEAISWLKQNVSELTDYTSNFDFEGSEGWRIFVEYIWYRRNTKRLRFALAKYGCTLPTLSRLKKLLPYRKTLLSNSLAYAEQGFIKGGNNIFTQEEVRDVLSNWQGSKDEFLILSTNPKLSRDLIVEILSEGSSLYDIDNEEQSCAFIAALSENPILKERLPAEARYHYYSERDFDKIREVFLSIIHSSPVSKNWSIAIRKLLEANDYIYHEGEIDTSSFMAKWADNPEIEKPKIGSSDEASVRRAFWEFFIRNVRHYQCPIMPDNEHPEALQVMVNNLPPEEWLAHFIDDPEFEPPTFNGRVSDDQYDEEKQKSPETQQVKLTIQGLFDRGVTTWDFMLSDHFYVNAQRRRLLRNIVNGFDESITDWEVVARREDEFFQSNPEYFEDASNLDTDESDWNQKLTQEIEDEKHKWDRLSIFIHSSRIEHKVEVAGVNQSPSISLLIPISDSLKTGTEYLNHTSYSNRFSSFFETVFNTDDQQLASLDAIVHDITVYQIEDDSLPAVSLTIKIESKDNYRHKRRDDIKTIPTTGDEKSFDAAGINFDLYLGVTREQFASLISVFGNEIGETIDLEPVVLSILMPSMSNMSFHRSYYDGALGPSINYRCRTNKLAVSAKRSLNSHISSDYQKLMNSAEASTRSVKDQEMFEKFSGINDQLSDIRQELNSSTNTNNLGEVRGHVSDIVSQLQHQTKRVKLLSILLFVVLVLFALDKF